MTNTLTQVTGGSSQRERQLDALNGGEFDIFVFWAVEQVLIPAECIN